MLDIQLHAGLEKKVVGGNSGIGGSRIGFAGSEAHGSGSRVRIGGSFWDRGSQDRGSQWDRGIGYGIADRFGTRWDRSGVSWEFGFRFGYWVSLYSLLCINQCNVFLKHCSRFLMFLVAFCFSYFSSTKKMNEYLCVSEPSEDMLARKAGRQEHMPYEKE